MDWNEIESGAEVPTGYYDYRQRIQIHRSAINNDFLSHLLRIATPKCLAYDKKNENTFAHSCIHF